MWVEPPRMDRDKVSPVLVRALSLGHSAMMADWAWIHALQDTALFHVPEGVRASIYYDFDLATDLDPAFAEVYMYGANLLVVVRDDAVGGADLLKKGEKFRKEELPKYPKEFRDNYWRRTWWIPLTLGYTYLYELNDVVGAAEAFGEAGKMEGAPEHVRNLGKRLKTKTGQYDVALNIIDLLISQAKDDRVVEGLEKKRRNLLLSKYVFDLNTDFREFLEKQPEYRRSVSPPRDVLQKLWVRFQRELGGIKTDPVGGVLSLDTDGKIQTTTERTSVFGLD